PELLLVERELRLIGARAIAFVEQFGNFELPRQRALAPHLRWMGGQHRTHHRAVEKGPERRRLNAVRARVLEGEGERAAPRRRACDRMRAVAADVMLVFGDVGEMREIAEG